MTYTTHTRLRKLLNDPNDDALPGDLIDILLDQCEAKIDSMLAHLYTVPFADYPSTPRIIRAWAEQLTTYEILKHPRFRLEKPVDTAMIEQAREVGVAALRDTARKKMRIPGLKARDLTHSNTSERVRTFGLDEPEDWAIDPDTLQEVADGREKT